MPAAMVTEPIVLIRDGVASVVCEPFAIEPEEVMQRCLGVGGYPGTVLLAVASLFESSLVLLRPDLFLQTIVE